MPSASRPHATVRRRRRWNAKQAALAFALIVPNLLLLAVFTYRPLIDNIRLSFYSWNISSPKATFIGLDNYVEWFKDPVSWQILWNTVVFTGFAVVGSMVLGLALALPAGVA